MRLICVICNTNTDEETDFSMIDARICILTKHKDIYLNAYSLDMIWNTISENCY